MSITAIHPGEHLAEELHELGMSASELARKLDVPPNRITAIPMRSVLGEVFIITPNDTSRTGRGSTYQAGMCSSFLSRGSA